MAAISFDPARQLTLYFRVARDGSKTFSFVDANGTAKDVSGYSFAFSFKYRASDSSNVFSIANGDLTRPSTDKITIPVSSTLTNVAPQEYYWQMDVTLPDTKVHTWLTGSAKFHNGEFDGVTESSTITVDESGSAVTIAISESGSENTDGSGTTVNGTAIDLGGAATKNTDIDTSESGYAWDFQIGGDDGAGNSAILTLGIGDFINSFTLGANLLSTGGGSQVSMRHTLAASAGVLQLIFTDANGALFTDTRSTKKGIQYAATGYVTDPRSLTDKGYVDTVRVQTVVSSATITPNLPTYQAIKVTAQAEGLTIANPTGTIAEMNRFMIRIKDDGTSRSLSFGTEYRAVGVTLPSATTISKTLYIEAIRNATDSKWDVILVREEA